MATATTTPPEPTATAPARPPGRRRRESRGLLQGAWFVTWLVSTLVVTGAAAALSLPLAVVVAAAAVGFFWLSQRPTAAALTMLAVVPITSGLARGNLIPGLRISEVITVALSLVVLLTADRNRDSRWTAVDVMLAAFALFAFVLGLLGRWDARSPISFGDFGAMLGPFQYFLFARALGLALQTSRLRLLGMQIVVLASLLVSTLAILQPVVPGLDGLLKGQTGYIVVTYGDSVERVTSLFPHFQPLSAYLLAIILLGTSLVAFAENTPRMRRWMIAALALATVALVDTLTISSMAAMVIGVASLALWTRQRARYLGGLALAVVVIGVVFSGPIGARLSQQETVTIGTAGANRSPLIPETIAFRWEVWTHQSLPALRGHELLGVGPTLPGNIAWRATESQYLDLLFNGGVVLFAVFATLWIVVVRTGRAAARARDPGTAAAGRALFVLTLLLVVTCFIQPYLTYGGISHVVWMLAALSATAIRATAREPATVPAAAAPRLRPGPARRPLARGVAQRT